MIVARCDRCGVDIIGPNAPPVLVSFEDRNALYDPGTGLRPVLKFDYCQACARVIRAHLEAVE